MTFIYLDLVILIDSEKIHSHLHKHFIHRVSLKDVFFNKNENTSFHLNQLNGRNTRYDKGGGGARYIYVR